MAQPSWLENLKIDRYARNTPDAYASSPEQLARYLTQPYPRDRDKVRVIFAWVAQHIGYDLRPPVANVTRSAFQAPQQVLLRRKAVCEGYSNLFGELCRQAGLQAEVIHGYARQGGLSGSAAHSWNAVHLDGEWKLLDVTWSAGYMDLEGKYQPHFQDRYYLTDPRQFVQEHLPYDPLWQLLYRPLSLADFQRPAPPPALDKGPIAFHFPDTLARVAGMDAVAAQEAALRRMIAFDPGNESARTNLATLQLQQAATYAQLAIEHLRDYQFLTSWGRRSHRVLRSETSVLSLLDRAEEHLHQMLHLYRHIHPNLPAHRETMKKNEEMVRHNLDFIASERKFLQEHLQVEHLPEKK